MFKSCQIRSNDKLDYYEECCLFFKLCRVRFIPVAGFSRLSSMCDGENIDLS